MLQGREEKQVLSENGLRVLGRMENVRPTKVSGDSHGRLLSVLVEVRREGPLGWLPRQAFPS